MKLLCCFAGCTEEVPWYRADEDLPLEEIVKHFVHAGNSMFPFTIYECGGEVHCSPNESCDWRQELCTGAHTKLFSGYLCREHLANFLIPPYIFFPKELPINLFAEDWERDACDKIAKADPEMFDRSRADTDD